MSSSSNGPNKVKIFFDGNCIVCDMEISHYSRMHPEIFELVDISAAGFDAHQYGLKDQDVNKNMHVQTEAGEMKIGVDAFAYIWSKIPKYSIFSRLVLLPGVYRLAKMGYWVFAQNRHLLPKKVKSA